MQHGFGRIFAAVVMALAACSTAGAVPVGQPAPLSDVSGLNITAPGSNVGRTAGARAADEINGLDFSTLVAAASQATATGKPLRLPAGSYSYSGGTTLTIRSPVIFEPGAVLSCSGSDVAFAGLLSAPRSQIFASGCAPTIAKVQDAVYPDWWGAVPDATGVSGFGTDDTAAFKAAMAVGWNKVKVVPGTYRVTSAIPIASGTTIECGGQENTFITLDDTSGTSDLFGVNVGNSTPSGATQVSIQGCNLSRAQQATAGALIHLQATYLIRMRDNKIGSTSNTFTWDGVRVDCGPTSAGNVLELYFEGNAVSAKHDDVNFQCAGGSTATVADVFFEKRNYLANATNAAIEAAGDVGWIHFDQTDFDQNSGTAMLVNGSGGAGNPAFWSIHDSHFEGNGSDINWTGVTLSIVTGNDFLSSGAGAGITCTSCNQIVTGNNQYTVNSHLILNGSSAWTESGSNWSATNVASGMIQIGPNGTNASTNITIYGGSFAFTYLPFVAFTGSAYPASDIKILANELQGSCFGGTNYVAASFLYQCGKAGDSSTFPGSVQILSPSNGVLGNLYFGGSGWNNYANGGAGGFMFGYDFNGTGTKHSIEFLRSTNNTSGAGASAGVGLAGYVDQYGGLTWLGGLAAPVVNAGNYAVAALPTGQTAGARSSVNDAVSCTTRLGSVTGGGSTFCPVIYNGSVWVQE